MSKINLSQFFKSTQSIIVKHGPEILTGIGIAGMITTTVLAVKSTPRALRRIEDAEDEKGGELTVQEKVKACWKCYIPATVTGVASTACLISATSVSARRTAALAAAYQISETALTEYRDKVVETIGEKKEETVREKIADDKIKKNPVSKAEVVDMKKGISLCFDPLSSRYFKSDIELIRRAENDLNKSMIHGVGTTVCLNEFYDEIGLERTELGEDIGWSTDHLISLHITSHVTDKGEPALVIGHYTAPRYDYYY